MACAYATLNRDLCTDGGVDLTRWMMGVLYSTSTSAVHVMSGRNVRTEYVVGKKTMVVFGNKNTKLGI